MHQNAIACGEVPKLFHDIELVFRPLRRIRPVSGKGVLTCGLAIFMLASTAAVSANWMKPKNAMTRLPKSAVQHY
jgi:hypothetical protein